MRNFDRRNRASEEESNPIPTALAFSGPSFAVYHLRFFFFSLFFSFLITSLFISYHYFNIYFYDMVRVGVLLM